MVRIEVSVRCINDFNNTCIYSVDYTYCEKGHTIVQSEADDYTKALASDALLYTHTLLKNQIKTEFSDKETDVVRKKSW